MLLKGARLGADGASALQHLVLFEDGKGGSMQLEAQYNAADDVVSFYTALTALDGTVALGVSINGGLDFSESSVPFTFTFEPSITGLEPASGPVGGASLVQVTGTFLRATPELSCRFGAAMVPGTYVPPTDPKDLVGGGVRCATPASSAGAAAVSVSLNGQQFFKPLPFSFYDPPVFFSLAPKCGPENGGGIVSVGGIGLGSGDALACRFGETPVSATMHTDGGVEQLRCASPTLAVDDGSTAQSMLVALNGQQFESAGEYHVYSTPVVSAVLPGSGLLSKSTGIVISGPRPQPLR